MRRVHSFCLYCSEEYEDERMLSTCCGPQHIRSSEVIPEEDFSEILARALKKDMVDKENCEMTPEKEGDEKDEFI
jgi:hypothetical protein